MSPYDDDGPRLSDPLATVPPVTAPPIDTPTSSTQPAPAVRRARRSAPHDIVLFRLARAEAAGVDYDTYVTELLERGRRLQRGDDPEELRARWRRRGGATRRGWCSVSYNAVPGRRCMQRGYARLSVASIRRSPRGKDSTRHPSDIPSA